jgi:hypothetical protein
MIAIHRADPMSQASAWDHPVAEAPELSSLSATLMATRNQAFIR